MVTTAGLLCRPGPLEDIIATGPSGRDNSVWETNDEYTPATAALVRYRPFANGC